MKASRWEALGAWLGVWTPPRDVEVPPPPSARTLAWAAAALVGLGIVVALVIAPAIDAGKDRAAAEERAARAQRAAARREAQRVQQRPRQGALPAGAGRAAALAAVGDLVLRDARARFAPEATRTTCRPYPPSRAGRERAASGPRAAYDCLVVVREFARGRTGVPYRAVVDFAAGRYAFCKINPVPSERVLPDPRLVVRLEPPCRDPAS
jgi:hypothetical protein